MTCHNALVPTSLSTPISQKPDENILSIPKVGTGGGKQKKGRNKGKRGSEKNLKAVITWFFSSITRSEINNWVSSANSTMEAVKTLALAEHGVKFYRLSAA